MPSLVSVLIPCYNAECWIAQAIESALAQTWAKKEIIVVDDGSTDRSLDIIKSFDGRIHWETGPNRGGGAARSRLLELSSGDWLQYLDADDFLEPQKVEFQVDYLRMHPDCDVVCSPTAWIRVENGTEIRSDTTIPEPRDPWILLALWRLPQTGGALWKKSALLDVGGWRLDQPCCQEHELYCRLLENDARFEYCDGCYAVYRDMEHPGRITRRPDSEFVRQRLRILERIETCLDRTSQLTSARRQAVNDARHEIARRLWKSDQAAALDLYKRILSSDSSFRPSISAASPRFYSMVVRALGFKGAQIAASCARVVKRW